MQLVQEGSPPQSQYRVVAYPAPKGIRLRPASFATRDKLAECLHAALPQFDQGQLIDGNGPHVLFAGDMEVTRDQLAALGVTR